MFAVSPTTRSKHVLGHGYHGGPRWISIDDTIFAKDGAHEINGVLGGLRRGAQKGSITIRAGVRSSIVGAFRAKILWMR